MLCLIFFVLFGAIKNSGSKEVRMFDICDRLDKQNIYLEFGKSGSLIRKFDENNYFDNIIEWNEQKKCTVEFTTCSSCVVEIKFGFLNISRNCGKPAVFDSCACDYIFIYEPQFQRASGEQFCGFFLKNNGTSLNYTSKTRNVVVTFFFSKKYEHAFTLDYSSKRNRILISGYPKYGNNFSQTISTPFFPDLYPPYLNIEQVIQCEIKEKCRISLIFTDFQIDGSSIIEFFDSNGQRLLVARGNIFRPPVIVSTGPALAMRFYANRAQNIGYKADYSFLLKDFNETIQKPDIDCGGYVNNLGGVITMMKMVSNGSKFFDCIWIIKPPDGYYHMKTQLSVKIAEFSNFVDNSELSVRQGLTSKGALVEFLKYAPAHFDTSEEKEHVVSISQGFYIRFKGLFQSESRLAVIYAAYKYKDCYAGSDFLCQNLRCISVLLSCDGFDHCGDNSDELSNYCSIDPQRDRRNWSQKPYFLFPQINGYNELTTTTLLFLLLSFGGLVGLIFALFVLLYRINMKSRHQRQIQDHIETIQAIFEDGMGDDEEEMIIPDDPPNYEAPPNYDDVIKNLNEAKAKLKKYPAIIEQPPVNSLANTLTFPGHLLMPTSPINNIIDFAGTSQNSQAAPSTIPDSPPPTYVFLNTKKIQDNPLFNMQSFSFRSENHDEINPKIALKNFDFFSRLRNIPGKGILFQTNYLRRCKSAVSLKKIHFPQIVKCFSESELCGMKIFHSEMKQKYLKLGRSFSTNDVSSLL